MFVQVIEAHATDVDGVRKRLAEWDRDVKAGAAGFLGSTAGVADDGTFILAARFESAEAAKANSDRPEQGEWWAGMDKVLDGGDFYDCDNVYVMGEGGSDKAGFVQVIQGHIKDWDGVVENSAAFTEMMREMRPDIIGGFIAVAPGDRYHQFAYFKSEAEAREGESKEMPPGMQSIAAEWEKHATTERFIDLSDPIYVSK